MEKNIGYTIDFLQFFFLPLILWLIYSLSVVDNMGCVFSGLSKSYGCDCILIIIAASHFQLGIQVILEDYVSDKNSRNSYLKILNTTYYLLSFIWFSFDS